MENQIQHTREDVRFLCTIQVSDWVCKVKRIPQSSIDWVHLREYYMVLWCGWTPCVYREDIIALIWYHRNSGIVHHLICGVSLTSVNLIDSTHPQSQVNIYYIITYLRMLRLFGLDAFQRPLCISSILIPITSNFVVGIASSNVCWVYVVFMVCEAPFLRQDTNPSNYH